MSRHWEWDTEGADWSVALDETTGLLRWRGVDKPRAGVPAYAQGGGEIEQKTWDLLTTGRPAYQCPPEILVDVLRAARAALPEGPAPTCVRAPRLADASIERVVRALQAAVRRLTGSSATLAESVHELLVEDVPDDRPTQSSGTRYFTGVRLGDSTFLLCTLEVGGWFQGASSWWTVDFAGTGQMRMTFDRDGVEIEGAPRVVEALANAFLMDTSPDDDDLVVHERAHAAVRQRFSGKPDVVWEVKGEMCREGVIVTGRASGAALDLYWALVPLERYFIVHVVDIDRA